MTAPKGWCPGAHRPMAARDGLIFRIKPPLARLSPNQMAGLADISNCFATGDAFLTSRANLQLRGVKKSDHPTVLAALDSVGLVDPTPKAEARRNIVIAPDWSDGDLTHRIAQALSANWIAADIAVPAKFGLAVDTGAAPLMAQTSADIRIERDETGLIVRPDGWPYGTRVKESDVSRAVLELANWFVTSGGMTDGRGRMSDHVRRVSPPQACDVPAAQPGQAPRPGTLGPGWLVAAPEGRLTAGNLTAMAGLGPIRLTPWRAVLIEGLRSEPHLPGLITRADDPRLAAVARMDLVLDGANT